MPSETCVTRAWRSHQQEVFAFLCRRLGDTEAAADLLQLVFLKALREGRRFCELESPRAWLFTVARNALTDHLRTRRILDVLPDGLAAEAQDRVVVDSLADCLPVAFAALSEADRDALTHCELGGMTQREYAAERGLSLAGAKSRVQRARARLRDVLIQVCGVRFDRDTGKVCCFVPRSGEASVPDEQPSAPS